VTSTSLEPPTRLLCGPGPSNVAEEVLAAMQKPMLGHLDPGLHDILLEVVEMLGAAYLADGLCLPLQATGTSGMEAGVVNLLEPGDTAIVAVCGYFGRRLADMAERAGARVVRVEADWGSTVPNEALLDALDRHPETRLIAVIHAETSTGVQHPLRELGALLREKDVLLMADCVTSLGGIELRTADWGVDFAYSCTQKCLAAPPGMSPLAISSRAMDTLAGRSTPVPFSFDLRLLQQYWVDRPAIYHNTIPVLNVYALHQALCGVLQEGLEQRWTRHAEAGAHLQARARERGLELLADPDHQLPCLTAIRVPDGVDAKRVQSVLLHDHGIEIGGGLGPQAPPMWRLGLMGRNASTETADRLFDAFDSVLSRERIPSAR